MKPSSQELVGPRLIALLAPFLAISVAKADRSDEERAALVFDFVGNYCLDCHDSLAQKGDRDFEDFELPLETLAQVITADEIIDSVTLKEMPPKKADQPSEEERIAVIRALRESIAVTRDKFDSTGGRTVMRRLSKREYENTLATLFDRRVDTLGLTADFPKEKTRHHMDNIGAALVTSGFLLDQYFQSAHRLVEARLGKPIVEPRSWHFTKNFKQYEELAGSHREVFNYEYLCLYEQPNTDTRQGGYGHIEDFLEGVPVSGLYDIEVLACALHRDTHYDSAIFGIDLTEPFQLAVVTGDATKGHIHYPQGIEPVLDQTIVPDDKPEWLSFRVWLEAGQTPRFIFPNGPYESRASVQRINQVYKDEFMGGDYRKGVSRAHILREGALPHIRIGEIKVHGPLKEQGHSREEIAVFGPEGFQEKRALDQLYTFGERAFRRPLDDSDRQQIRRTHEKRLAEEATPRQAALDTVKMILCSPSFLYLSEVTPEDEETLRPYDLASRLSYALWAAPPDRDLLAAAASGKLAKPEVLAQQARRMLADERSQAFVVAFLDSWQNLREIGAAPPPRPSNKAYYAEDLPTSMKEEARRFFRHLLDSNGPVTDFLDADYTFVDKKLARHYGLPEKETLRLADGFQRVTLKDNPQRGGVLGMAGVLTVSANGVETSPVTRGVWILENLLGITPPPPPDEVPAIENDVSGAKTIREKLARHSEDRTCYECHRKIDPLGFGLENFDPTGRWRTDYPRPKPGAPAQRIDASGEMASGETYADFDAFKRVLVDTRQDFFVHGLTEKLLTYATGRQMERVDEYEIEDILQRVKADGLGLQSLVLEVLTSKIFRSR